MNNTGGATFIPDRRVFEELRHTQGGVWRRFKAGGAAAHDWLNKARIKIQDRFLPVLRAQEAVIAASGQPLPESHNAYIAKETFSGKVGRHLFEIDEDYTKPIIDVMAAGRDRAMLDPDEVGTWLYARHALERNMQIASINPSMPDGGSGMTDAEAQAILQAVAVGPDAARFAQIGKLVDALRGRQLTRRFLRASDWL